MSRLRQQAGMVASRLRAVKASGQLRNLLTFLVFVAMAALFWFIMALNDNVQDSFDVSFRITNVPDSVTFINDPPDRIHVTVRDRGTRLLRLGRLQHPSVNVDFRNFSSDGRFRYTRQDLLASLKQTFGVSAAISAVSVDSVSLAYTTSPGRRVAVRAEYSVSAVSGKVVMPSPVLQRKTALVYGEPSALDTIHVVYTERIVLSNLEETKVVNATMLPIPGVKIVPDHMEVTFRVEPLVKKESYVVVTADDIPSGQDLLFFPARVQVVYYVPMSYFGSEDDGIVVKASYHEAMANRTERVGLDITYTPPYVKNPSLPVDSVEYTIVKGQ